MAVYASTSFVLRGGGGGVHAAAAARTESGNVRALENFVLRCGKKALGPIGSCSGQRKELTPG